MMVKKMMMTKTKTVIMIKMVIVVLVDLMMKKCRLHWKIAHPLAKKN